MDGAIEAGRFLALPDRLQAAFGSGLFVAIAQDRPLPFPARGKRLAQAGGDGDGGTVAALAGLLDDDGLSANLPNRGGPDHPGDGQMAVAALLRSRRRRWSGEALSTRGDTITRHLLSPERLQNAEPATWTVDETSLLSARDTARLFWQTSMTPASSLSAT